MKATTEGVFVSWDEYDDLLRCVNDGMQLNHDGMRRQERKRKDNRSEAIIDLWKKDRNRCARVGNALVDAYKELHPEANVQYAKVLE